MYVLEGERLTGRSAMISSKLWSMFDYGMVGNEAERQTEAVEKGMWSPPALQCFSNEYED